MGCCPARNRHLSELNVRDLVLPEQPVTPLRRSVSRSSSHKGSAEVRYDQAEESSSSESSAGVGALTPEQQWLKQARRQARQQRQRARQRESARKALVLLPGSAQEKDPAMALKLCELYTIGPLIGSGTYSSVSRCVHISTRRKFALKTTDRRRAYSASQLQEEVAVMWAVSQSLHKNIVQLIDAFEEAGKTHLVMELCEGGQLSDHLRPREDIGLENGVAAALARQMASAVQFLHSRSVAHRDLKPENFMLSRRCSDLGAGVLKLIDFGLSKRFLPGVALRSLAYTVHYAAPEVLEGNYTEACDLWSLGATFYVLVCGSLPFPGASETQVLSRIKAGNFNQSSAVWAEVHALATDTIRSLLVLDPKLRLSALELSRHPWLLETVQTKP